MPDPPIAARSIRGAMPMPAAGANPEGVATPTMTSVFTDHAITESERRGLVAYLEEAPKQAPGADDSSARLNFFLIGLGGSVLALALFDGLWKKRFHGVRRRMVVERNARIMS